MASLRIFLRQGEKLFLNGAVLRADRKVALEVLNDVSFLLEGHVIQAEDTHTPLRQLYFVIQTMLIDPMNANDARKLYERSHALLSATVDNPDIKHGLEMVNDLMRDDRAFEALKVIRALFATEQMILRGELAPAEQREAG